VTDRDISVRLLAEFQEKAEALGVVVLRAAAMANATKAVTEWAASLTADRVLISSDVLDRAPEVAAALSSAGLQVLPHAPPAVARDVAVGVSLARMAIAETGSVLLSEPTLADRAVSLLTLAHVILIPTDRLVPSLDAAAPELRALALEPGGGFSTLVTGPSRTADIERVLTVGVQGPGMIMNLFVDDL
jgi:L-lactate dehydrogenase complex protein LldG